MYFRGNCATAQGGVRRYNYGLHFAKVATRELALCVWFCVGYKAKADVRRYNIFLIYARKIAFWGDFSYRYVAYERSYAPAAGDVGFAEVVCA